MSDGPRACKICQGGFSQLFRGQNIKQRVLNTFEVQINIDGNVCCPTCLYHMDVCHELIAKDNGETKHTKQSCNSCGAKGKLSHKFLLPAKELPAHLVTLPYFRRLVSSKSGSLKMCPKCIVVVEFSKKLFATIGTDIVDSKPPLSMPLTTITAAFETLTKEAKPPRPPLIVKFAVPAARKSIGKRKSVDNAQSPTTVASTSESEMDQPLLPKAKSKETVTLSVEGSGEPLLRKDSIPPLLSAVGSIKLPKGVKMQDLTCSVVVERLRVPPIKIRALKLQSIIKGASPEKSNQKKRVSFSNRHSIAEIPARRQSSSTKSSSSSSSSEEEAEDSEPIKRLRKKPPVDYSIRNIFLSSSSDDEVLVRPAEPAKRLRKNSSRAMYLDPPSSTTSSSSEDEEDKRPLKKFKGYRPSPSKRNSEKLISPPISPKSNSPEVVVAVNGKSPTPPTSSICSERLGNSPVKRNLFPTNGTIKSSPKEPKRPKRSSSRKSSLQVASQPTAAAAGDLINSQSPRRRLSVDSVISISTKSGTDKDESPLKISHRRKTMGSSSSQSTSDLPAYGRVRLVSIDKLRAPNPQVDLLLANIPVQTVLPHPFMPTP